MVSGYASVRELLVKQASLQSFAAGADLDSGHALGVRLAPALLRSYTQFVSLVQDAIMPRSPFLSPAVQSYLVASVGEEPALLQQLRTETRTATEHPGMQIGADQGRFLALLLELVGAERAIEVGVFTGYSSICIAQALPAHGKLIACDVSDEWTQIACRYWQLAGVSERIELTLGPALDTLGRLVRAGDVGTFDFAFIDADKGNYDGYYELCLQLLRTGGLIAVDNALWGGSVADASDERPDTVAIRNLNAKVFADPRVTASLVPVGDGVLLARKR